MYSTYMPWAKLESGAGYKLAISDVDLGYIPPVDRAKLALSGPITNNGRYGYAPLLQAIAKRTGVTEDRVVTSIGASMANYLVLAACLDRGDEVLIEHPVYELILAAARFIGAEVKRFERTHESGFALDPPAIEKAITPRTKLIVCTNLHNPSSSLADESAIRRIGEMARSVRARVLVNEVYRDAAFEHAQRSAAQFGDEFITTSSLTKVYGLSGLRCGWIVAAPDLAHRMWRLNDLFGVNPAHLAEQFSVAAFDNLAAIAAQTRARLDENRKTYHRFLDSRADLDAARFDWGTVSFPKLLHGDVSTLCKILRDKYDTTVVPGEFFEMPDHFRVGIGGKPEDFNEGLRRLGLALDDIMEHA
jgi:aspartate/methionine/tyrosine aminotransferase